MHVDIWGPSMVSSDGYRFFMTLVDDCSRFTWAVMIHTKGEAPQVIKNFCNMVETQFNSKIKIIRSNNGPEFKLTDFYNLKGINH